jgi:surface antigen
LDAGLSVDTYRRMLRSFELTGALDTADTLPPTPQHIFVGPLGDSSCCGYSDPGNPYGCYSCGNCTWWASFKGSYLPDTSWGDAWQWKQAAISQGFSVGTSPQANTVVVLQPGVQGVDSTHGHVAYVESVDGSNFVVSEMWYPNGCDNVCCRVCTSHSYHSGTGVDFIYRPGTTCSAPSLNSPGDGYVHTSTDRTITFSWSPPSNCTPDGYTFRVKTVPDMDSGGTTIFDEGQGGTQVTKQFGSQWDNTDLYWSVRACKPCTPYNPGPWAPSRRFRIQPGQETHRECRNYQCVEVSGGGSDQCSSDSDCAPPSGTWHADYFDNTDWAGSPRHTEDFSGLYLDKNWGGNSPGGGVPTDNWSARFTRQVNFSSGDYVFYMSYDDGAKLFLDGQNIWDQASHPEDVYICPPRHLSGNHTLRVDFREYGGDARVKLTWDTDASHCGCTDILPVGSGSSRQQLFQDAYDRNGGRGNLGCTQSGAIWWGTGSKAVVRQDFTGTDHWGDAVITHDEQRDFPMNTIPAYVVHGHIFDRYVGMGPDSWLGPPTSDEYQNLSGARQSSFGGGYITDKGSGYQAYSWPSSFSSWKAEYFNNRELVGYPTYVRNESSIDHDWGTGAPESGALGVFDDNFAVRWSRTLSFAGGRYRFTTTTDDGVRLRIDGTLVTDEWHDGGGQVYPVERDMSAGDHSIQMEYYEHGGAANARLEWVLVAVEPPAPPSNLAAQAVSQSQINLTWDSASTDVTTFFIARSMTGSDPWTLIDWVDGSQRSYQDTGLGCAMTLYYKLMAYRSADDQYSEYSNTASASTEACCADANEPNDTPAQATSIAYSEWEYNGLDICPAGDVDYYAFEGNAGDEITAETRATSTSLLDTYLYLYDVDGASVLTENDDYVGYDSHIEWTLPSDGVYYLKVREYNHPVEGGPDYRYWMTLRAGGPNVGPLAYHSHTVDDDNQYSTFGDDDGIADCGETVNLQVPLENPGLLTAYWVTGALTTSDPYLTWLRNVGLWFAQQFPPGTTTTNFEDRISRPEHLVALAPATPDGHLIHFDLYIDANNGGPWQESFDMLVECPSQPSPQISVRAAPESALMDAGQYRDIAYELSEDNGVSAHIHSRTAIFTTLSGTPISSDIGPYPNDIDVPGAGMASWVDHVYLPPDVYASAESLGASSVLLRTTFAGEDPDGRPVSAEATLQILLVKTRLRLPLAVRGS